MAPFRRGTKGRGGSALRGRGSTVGRGRGRGRGGSNSAAANGPKSTFYSTRVEEARQDNSENDQAITEESVDEEVSLHDSIEDDADLAAVSPVKPYHTLLRSLDQNVRHDQPPLKKRRLAQEHGFHGSLHLSPATEIGQPDGGKDLDFAEEPELEGNISPNEPGEDDSFDPEIDDCRLAPAFGESNG